MVTPAGPLSVPTAVRTRIKRVVVAVDARKLWDGGIGTHLRGMLAALADHAPMLEIVALVDPRDQGSVSWPAAGPRERPVRAAKYGLDEHWAVPAAARQAGAQLLHEPHYTLPLGWRGPAVVTIHDLIQVRFPRSFPPGAALYARAMAGSACARARLVLVNSEHTRREVLELLKPPPAKLRVVPHAVSERLRPPPAEQIEQFRRAHRLPLDYLLYVGARKPHKNLPLLFEALAILPAATRPPLVLAGPAWEPGHPLDRLAVKLGIRSGVSFCAGARDDDSLSRLYAGAALYVQPSLAEGFGLPPLEAMACGTPVLCSNAAALPETVGDAAVLLAPEDPERWAVEIARLLSDPRCREDLARRGLARARSFRFERTAKLTAQAYLEALDGGG